MQTIWTELVSCAQSHNLSAAMGLGLGAGVYFEYYRRPSPAPTRFITGLHRAAPTTLTQRAPQYAAAPEQTVRAALRENALWFNLDRQPTAALLGMELWAEELAFYDALPDWRVSLQAMARTILDSDALYRRIYLEFLQTCAPFVPTSAAQTELSEIVNEWLQLANCLQDCAASAAPALETPSRLVRRLAFREEHFWGKVLDV